MPQQCATWTTQHTPQAHPTATCCGRLSSWWHTIFHHRNLPQPTLSHAASSWSKTDSPWPSQNWPPCLPVTSLCPSHPTIHPPVFGTFWKTHPLPLPLSPHKPPKTLSSKHKHSSPQTPQTPQTRPTSPFFSLPVALPPFQVHPRRQRRPTSRLRLQQCCNVHCPLSMPFPTSFLPVAVQVDRKDVSPPIVLCCRTVLEKTRRTTSMHAVPSLLLPRIPLILILVICLPRGWWEEQWLWLQESTRLLLWGVAWLSPKPPTYSLHRPCWARCRKVHRSATTASRRCKWLRWVEKPLPLHWPVLGYHISKCC